MKVQAINTARNTFKAECIERGKSFSTVCLTFVRACSEAVDEGDEMATVEARCFGEKSQDLLDWLTAADCSNPRMFKMNMRKALYAICVLGSDAATLGGLVSAYDKEWPTAKGKASKAAKKEKAETLTIEVSKLMDLVIQSGLTKAEAARFLAAAKKLAA